MSMNAASCETMVVPSSVKLLGYGCFSEMLFSLKFIVLPEHFTDFSLGLLAGCIALQLIELPKQLVTIH